MVKSEKRIRCFWKAFRYLLKEMSFNVSNIPFITNYMQISVTIYAFADDAIANRSGSYRKSFTFSPPLQPTLALRPILECVQANTNGTFTARFGYESDNPVPVTISIGGHNKFTPAPQDKGQPTVFQSGRRQNVFSVVFGNHEIRWSIKGPDGERRDVSASVNSSRCQ